MMGLGWAALAVVLLIGYFAVGSAPSLRDGMRRGCGLFVVLVLVFLVLLLMAPQIDEHLQLKSGDDVLWALVGCCPLVVVAMLLLFGPIPKWQ